MTAATPPPTNPPSAHEPPAMPRAVPVGILLGDGPAVGAGVGPAVGLRDGGGVACTMVTSDTDALSAFNAATRGAKSELFRASNVAVALASVLKEISLPNVTLPNVTLTMVILVGSIRSVLASVVM